MSALGELIERLEKATGHDRTLDARIEFALGHYLISTNKLSIWDMRETPPRLLTMRANPEDGVRYDEETAAISISTLLGQTPYTASIDAAMTLAKDDHFVCLERHKKHWIAHVSSDTAGPWQALHKNGATALCIAIFKSRLPTSREK